MEETYTSSAALAKRHREEEDKRGKEISQNQKIKATWEYLEDVKKLQSLEIETELLRKQLKLKENRFPDLKGLRGTVEHLSSDSFFEVDDDGKKRVFAGKSLEDATEKYRKRIAQEKKNAAKQKETAKSKNEDTVKPN